MESGLSARATRVSATASGLASRMIALTFSTTSGLVAWVVRPRWLGRRASGRKPTPSFRTRSLRAYRFRLASSLSGPARVLERTVPRKRSGAFRKSSKTRYPPMESPTKTACSSPASSISPSTFSAAFPRERPR